MKIKTLLLALIAMISLANATIVAQNYKAQADRFVAATPEGLQDRQIAAIEQAMAGDTTALQAVRNARNAESLLPEGVNAIVVGPNLRLYKSSKATAEKMPLLVYFHGGGWVLGSITTCARYCGALAATGKVMVLAVDYRLAPEHPYPQGLDDCQRAVEYAIECAEGWGGAPDMVSVGGDSSGGNLAVATALRFVGKDGYKPRSLMLYYPVVSAWADNSKSWKKYGKGAALDASIMEVFNQAYCGDDRRNPEVSVSLAGDEKLKQLPPVMLVAAERDILSSQGEAFVADLQKLGVDAQRVVLPGSVHLFITKGGQDAAFFKAVEIAEKFLCE